MIVNVGVQYYLVISKAYSRKCDCDICASNGKCEICVKSIKFQYL